MTPSVGSVGSVDEKEKKNRQDDLAELRHLFYTMMLGGRAISMNFDRLIRRFTALTVAAELAVGIFRAVSITFGCCVVEIASTFLRFFPLSFL